VILRSVLAMKRLESSEPPRGEVHRVYVDGRVVFSGNEDEALDMITDLSIQYYETGSPDPSTITLERIPEDG
jgi:beta-galactosidase beta subunit